MIHRLFGISPGAIGSGKDGDLPEDCSLLFFFFEFFFPHFLSNFLFFASSDENREALKDWRMDLLFFLKRETLKDLPPDASGRDLTPRFS